MGEGGDVGFRGCLEAPRPLDTNRWRSERKSVRLLWSAVLGTFFFFFLFFNLFALVLSPVLSVLLVIWHAPSGLPMSKFSPTFLFHSSPTICSLCLASVTGLTSFPLLAPSPRAHQAPRRLPRVPAPQS